MRRYGGSFSLKGGRAMRSFVVAVVVWSLLMIPHATAGSFFSKLGRAVKVMYQTDQLLWLVGDPAAERRFGYMLSRVTMLLNPLDKDEGRNAWVRKVFDRVVEPGRRRHFQYRIYLVRDKSINAFALPGGYIFINRGMVDFVKSDDELAAVLGHELAHVNRRHALTRLRKDLAFVTLVNRVWKANDDQQALASVVLLFENFRFSRNNEREADRLGMEWAKAAGYDPSGMVTLWERMLKKYGDRQNDLTKRLTTHPGHKERAETARKLLQEWGLPFTETNFLTYELDTPRTVRPQPNGDFEQPAGKDGAAPGWTLQNNAVVVDDRAHGGTRSLRLRRFGADGAPTATGLVVPYDPTSSLRLSAQAQAGTGRPSLWVGLPFYDADQPPLGAIYPAANGVSPPLTGWAVYEGAAGPALAAANRPPAGAHHVAVVLAGCRLGPGEVWVDDVVLEQTSAGSVASIETTTGAPRVVARPDLLPNGSFEDDGDGDGTPDRWLLSTGARPSTDRPADGGTALCLHGEQLLRREFAIAEMVPVAGGARYVIDAQVRARPAGAVELGYRLYTRDKRLIPSTTVLPEVAVSRDVWTTVETRLTVPGNQPAFVQVTVRARPAVGQSLWVDRVRLFNADVSGEGPVTAGPAAGGERRARW